MLCSHHLNENCKHEKAKFSFLKSKLNCSENLPSQCLQRLPMESQGRALLIVLFTAYVPWGTYLEFTKGLSHTAHTALICLTWTQIPFLPVCRFFSCFQLIKNGLFSCQWCIIRSGCKQTMKQMGFFSSCTYPSLKWSVDNRNLFYR